MRWHCFRLTYDLRSMLHIGYHKIGNVQRTRCYIPARNLWGAVTERLTRGGFKPGVLEGFLEIGSWIKEHCTFSYFFIHEGDTLLSPCYGEKGLCYGGLTSQGLTQVDFERRYLDAHVTTALDAATTSAETGGLHEVEFISAYRLDRGNDGIRTRIRGWVFLDEEALSCLGPGKWEEWLGNLQVGGERRYGFGRLALARTGLEPAGDWPPGYTLQPEGDRPWFKIAPGTALLAHTEARAVKAKGAIEPLVGREITVDGDFGKNLKRAGICWVPGSILDEEAALSIDADGCWKKKHEGGGVNGR